MGKNLKNLKQEKLKDEGVDNIYVNNIKMPRKRKTRKMRGGADIGTMARSSKELSNIRTANRNLRLENRLLSAKPSIQQPGQLARFKQYGGGSALRDKYGAFLYIPRG
jgi:hypothetical protein